MSFDDVLGRKVKQVCVSHGVSVVELSGFRSFALQLDKTRKRVSGHDFEVVACAVAEHCSKMGMRRDVLAAIAYDVFNVRIAD
jgi:hypothetical protein